jgi:putative resolvase
MTTCIVSDRIIKPQELLSMQQAAALAGVEVQTLRLWDRAGKLQCVRTEGNHRRVLKASLLKCLGIEIDSHDQSKIIGYTRVSTLSQSKDKKQGASHNGESDLDRQQQRVEAFIQEKFPDNDYEILTDVGSGLSENRKNYLRLIELICEQSISAIVIHSKDRLSRFGQESFSKLAEINGVEIIIVDREETEMEHSQEMAADVMAIMHIYSCRYYGKRSGERTKIDLDEATMERVHELRQQGIAYRHVITILNQEGFTNKNDEPFRTQNVRRKYQDWVSRKNKTAILTDQPQEKQLLDQWLEERCDKKQSEQTPTKQLYQSYADFVAAKGGELTSHRLFTQGMMKRGFEKGKLGRDHQFLRTLKGITLR